MSYWLFQMSACDEDDKGDPWRPEDYRLVVCEGKVVEWKWHKPMNIDVRGLKDPAPGDKVVFFFCKTGLRKGEKPGLYGLGEITRFRSDRRGRLLKFRPERPNDSLKMKPLWSIEVETIVNAIRGEWYQRTMWGMTDEEFSTLYAMMLATVEPRAVRQRRYPKDEFARRGNEIYETHVRPKVETDNRGKYVAIDIETGEWEMDASERAAGDRLRQRVPDAQTWIMRIGVPYIRRFGAGRVRRIA